MEKRFGLVLLCCLVSSLSIVRGSPDPAPRPTEGLPFSLATLVSKKDGDTCGHEDARGRETLAQLNFANSLFANADPQTFTFIDLQPWGNRKLSDNQGTGRDGADLNELPVGSKFYGDAKFKVEEKLIQLGSTVLDDLPEKVEGIKVDQRAIKLHILHATCFGLSPEDEGDDWFVKDGTQIGEYRVNYEDRTFAVIPIIYGLDVRDWFYREGAPGPTQGKVVWEGRNELATDAGKKIRIYSFKWENPSPDKRIISIDYSSKNDVTPAAPFCLAITAETKPAP